MMACVIDLGRGGLECVGGEVYTRSPEGLELWAFDEMQHVFCPKQAVTARVVIEVRVPVADVDGTLDHVAPLLLLGRVREVRAERSEDYAKAHYVVDAFFHALTQLENLDPNFCVVRKLVRLCTVKSDNFRGLSFAVGSMKDGYHPMLRGYAIL